MSKFDCPHCNQPTFTLWHKYFAAKWKVLTCSHCDRRVCSRPLLLALFYLLYLADVINFGYLSYIFHDMSWAIAAIVVWIILELFSIYLPLAAMRDGIQNSVKSYTALSKGET